MYCNERYPIDDIGVLDILSLVGASHGNIDRRGWTEVKCPRRAGEEKLGVNTTKNTWKCWKSCNGCPGGGRTIDLYRVFTDVASRIDAQKEIYEAFHGFQKVERVKAPVMEEVKLAKSACAEDRDKTYRALLKKLPLSNTHRESLRSRGMSDADIDKGLYRSLPTRPRGREIVAELQKEGYVLIGVPGFGYDDGRLSLCCNGEGFFIPYYDSDGHIIQLQIRFDDSFLHRAWHKDKAAVKGGRYRWLSSSGYEEGTPANNVPSFGPKGSLDGVKTVIVTEGALKAAVASSLSGKTYVSIPGVSCNEAFCAIIKHLNGLGITSVIDAFDSDRSTNQNVQNSLNKLNALAQDLGVKLTRFDWGTAYKGVDDYLLAKRNGAQAKKTLRDAPISPPVPAA